MTVINTNTASINAQYNLNKVNQEMEKAMEQLSSGKRVNTAADDAAGLAIATRMESQVRGLEQAMRNAADGQSLVDTTEGAHQEVTNILQRMRELAIQASNETNVASDRASLNDEVTQLQQEIDRIASQTTWNGVAVLDGSFTNKQLQIGAEADQTLNFSVDSVSSANLGSYTLESTAVTVANTTGGATQSIAGDDLTVSGHLGSSTIAVTAADSAKDVAALINAKTGNTGVSASAVTKLEVSNLGAAGTVSFTLTGNASASISASIASTTDLHSLVDAINQKSGVTGVTATFGTDTSKMILTHSSGEDISIKSFANSTAGNDTIDFRALEKDGVSYAQASDTLTEGGDVDMTVVGQMTLSSTHDFDVTGDDTVAANGFFTASGGGASTSGGSADLSNIASIDISTVTGANSAILAIDGAIDKINSARAGLGAVSNRLDHTISNLGNIQINIASSQSRIQDADFAKATGDLTKSQIMSQAATAMLAQANASKQGVLSLLQG